MALKTATTQVRLFYENKCTSALLEQVTILLSRWEYAIPVIGTPGPCTSFNFRSCVCACVVIRFLKRRDTRSVIGVGRALHRDNIGLPPTLRHREKRADPEPLRKGPTPPCPAAK